MGNLLYPNPVNKRHAPNADADLPNPNHQVRLNLDRTLHPRAQCLYLCLFYEDGEGDIGDDVSREQYDQGGSRGCFCHDFYCEFFCQPQRLLQLQSQSVDNGIHLLNNKLG